MRIIRDLRELEPLPRPSVVTVGNFDGVHLAHQRLLRSVAETARQTDAVAAAVTFEPHPARVLAPERAPKLLTPLERKARLIEEQGIG
ncbi:MAG: bifunctional riboflavin kinase/FAD synthetase, partial [Acidobacteria bacterium]